MYAPSPRQRTLSAVASLAIVGAGAAALILGLAGEMPLPRTDGETLVAITPEPMESPRPQPRPTPSPQPTAKAADEAQAPRPKDAPSPENLRNRATAVFAPVLPPLRPPPVVAAPRPADGTASNTGASDRVGPGQGAGGQGDGFGGGGQGGNGTGSGAGNTRPRQIRGKLRWSDLPRELREAQQGGELELVYRVNIDGRVSDCRITRSSGFPGLDAQTCRLITERFRFRPSLDPSGRPVPAYIEETHGWYNDPNDDPNWRGDD